MTSAASAATVSPTLGINERVHALRAEGRRIDHFGFGESPFPVPERLADALRAHATAKSYLPVAGLPALREAVLAHQERLTGCDPERFDAIVAPGSKLLLFAAQMAVPGDLLLPVPSWVSYAPQAAMLGQRVLPVRTDSSDAGFRLPAAAVDEAVANARAIGRDPTKLLINFPNNPSGLTLAPGALEEIAEACRRHGLVLISDEIYGRTSYDHDYRSAAAVAPELAVVTTGLSKHLSLGGWRLGVALVPRGVGDLFDRLLHIASETWSCVAAPVQLAAIEAYAGHDDVEAYVRDTTDVHALVNRRVAASLRDDGVEVAMPQGGFYTWPDFAPVLGHRYPTSTELARALLEEAGIAALPGTGFGEDASRLRLRLAACDYDGAAALRAWREAASDGEGRGARGADVARLAPGVEAALRRFSRFVRTHAG